MPPKAAKGKDSKATSKNPAKAGAAKKGGGKAKKKKWSKGKVRDKLNNAVLFDEATYEKLLKEVVSYKLITPSVLSERLKIRASLAKAGLRELLAKGLIKEIVHHSGQIVYTRAKKAELEEEAAEAAAAEAPKKGKKGGKKEKEPKE